MKKILIAILSLGLFATVSQAAIGFQEPPKKESKVTHNKVTHTTKKGAEKTGQGVKHGAYDVTHNKATEKTDINKGNQKYSNQNDINNDNKKGKY